MTPKERVIKLQLFKALLVAADLSTRIWVHDAAKEFQKGIVEEIKALGRELWP